MSQKKRGSNPIRITLTEDQISDIIQSAAKTRRGLKVEALEDRIAPSAIGAPMFGDPLDPNLPPTHVDPITVDPNLPPVNVDPITVDPNLPPTIVDPITNDPNLPPTIVDPITNDPNLPPVNVDPIGYQDTLPPAPVPPGGPTLPGGPVPPAPPAPPSDLGGDQPTLTDPNGGYLSDSADPVPPTPHVPGPSGDPAPVAPVPETTGGTLPSSEEIEEHRRNILRQLRGN